MRAKNFAFTFASVAAAAFLGQPVHAQTSTGWTGAVDNLWSTFGNWDNGAPPGGDTNTRNLFFGNAFVTAGGAGATTAQNDLPGYAGHRITFEDTAATTDPAFTLTGNAFTLFDFGGNAPRIENQSASLQTFNLGGALTLNGGALNFAEINPVNGDLLFSATTPIALAGTTQLRVFGTNGKTATFNGVISGANSVAINQDSNVIYGAANTYTGDTFINAGSLSIAQGGSLSAGTLQLGDTIASGAAATLRISDADGGTTVARPILVRAGSSGLKTIAASNTAGTNTFSGTIGLSDDVTFDVASGGALTASGVISGAETVNKTGGGLLTLSGANSFTGGLVLSGGRTRPTVGNTMSGGITLNAGGILEINTVGSASDASAQFNTFFGVAGNSFIFNGGTIEMTAATTATVDRQMNGRNVTVNAGGATFDIQGAYANFTEGILNQLRYNGASVLSGTGTLTKNGGGRLQFQNGTASGFSGAVVVNNGTLEASGGALGNASATNTVTVNGGNWALSGDASQKITLNGGAISTNGSSRTVNGTLDVTAPAGSYIFLNEFWRDFDSASPGSILLRNLTVNGVVSGDDPLGVAVNRAGWTSNNGTVILRNTGNTYSGTITVGKNLRLENNATAGFGKTLGSADIVLAEGGLHLRDNGDATGQTATVFNYGNNVSTAAPTGIFARGTMAGVAFIDVNRASGTVAANNTFKLGSLTLDRPLFVTGGNGYGLEFGNASSFTGNAVLNVNSGALTFSGGLTEDAAGRTLTKNGAGTLIFTSAANYTGATTITAGALTLSGAAGALSGTTALSIANAALNIDNSGAVVADRVADATPISLTSGSINFTSLTGAATNTSETLGVVTAAAGINTIAANQGNAGAISALTLASLTRQNGATVRVTGANLGQPGNSSRIILADQAADVALLGAWVTINGTDFAQYVAASDGGFARGVTVVDYVTDPADDSGFAASQNLRLTGTTTTALTADRAVNTVNFANTANTRTLDVGGNTLTLAGGGIIVGTNAAAITGTAAGGLTSGTSDLVITNNAALAITAPIEDNAGAVALTKTGTGTLTLSGASTFTGDLSVQQGTLAFSDVADTGTASNLGAAGTVRLSDAAATTLQFTGATDATNRPLVIGAAGATFSVTTAGSNLAWNGAITSSGPITKTGAGSFTLGGASNIAGNATVTTGTLGFGGTAVITGDLNIGINGNLGSANVSASAPAATSSLAGGSLTIGSGSANALNIGSHFAAGNNSYGVADFSNLSNLTVNVGNVRVAVDTVSGGSGQNAGILRLGQTSHITATSSFVVADGVNDGTNGTPNLATPGQLLLGSTANTIVTPVFTIGGRKYSSSLTVPAGSTPTFTLNNGAGRTTMNVGQNTISTGTAPISNFDLSGATFQANLGPITIGQKTGGGNGGVTANVNFGTSASTTVNALASAGQVISVGRLEFTSGFGAPTVNTSPTVATFTIGGGTHTYASSDTTGSAVLIGFFNNNTTQLPNFTNSVTGTLTIAGGNVTINSGGTQSSINVAPRNVFGTPTATQNATGTLAITGGSLTVNNQINGTNSTSANGGSTSTLSLSGGVLNMAGKNILGFTNLNFTGGTLRNLGAITRATFAQTGETSLLDVVANNTTITGAYTVTDGDVNIAATRILNATGGTTVSGTSNVIVNGSLQGSLTLNAGATVSGTGTTQGLTLAGGTIAPGNSPGILNSGALTLSGGNLALEINGTTPGTGHDQINVTGAVSLTANTDFTLSLGYVPAIGDQFVIINNDAADLVTFSGGALLAFNGGAGIADDTTFSTPQGFEFRLDYNGGTGNDIVLTTTIPEPTSATMLVAGLGSLLGLGRFRRRAR